jgi:hypothetical protein
MPYKHEHSARIVEPAEFQDFRRENDAFGKGVHVIYGFRSEKAPAEIQALRFDEHRFTDDAAHAWLADHDIDYLSFHPATEAPLPNPERAWLPLRLIHPAVPVMEAKGVSEVARSGEGFLTAYEEARGDPRRLGRSPHGEPWTARRNAFLARHYAQVVEHGESLWDAHGEPSRRHLALVAWAWTPDRKRWEKWLRTVKATGKTTKRSANPPAGSLVSPHALAYEDNPIGRAMRAADEARREVEAASQERAMGRHAAHTIAETNRKLTQAQAGAREYQAAHWGVAPDVVYEVEQPHLPRDQPLIEMGKLRELWISPETGRPYALTFDDNFTMLCFTRDKVQRLYIILSDEDRDGVRKILAADNRKRKLVWYGLPDIHADVGGRQSQYAIDDITVTCLGTLTDVVYLTEKKGDDVSEYKHEMGEEGGISPMLCADPEGYLFIAGGSYSVPNRGIIH